MRALALVLVGACGFSSAGNETVGQVKKVSRMTPLVCEDYTEVDISLGVLRNGVGSMSKEDILLAVDNSEHDTIDLLKKAADDGSIVKVTYDVKRMALCWPDHRLLTVTVEASP